MTEPHPDLARWNTRYSAEGYLFGESPNIVLRELASGIAPGRALCVADGEGRNGVWLAEQGWDVLSLDFSPVAQAKAADLAARRGVKMRIVQGDVHAWDYPEAAFDLVVEVFAQFSAPADRELKWAGMIRAVRPGGQVIVVGYTPRQLLHKTGGPSDLDRLYTPAMLRTGFGALDILRLDERELEMHEGAGHVGLSAVIGMVARKPA